MAFGITQLETRDWTFKNDVTVTGDLTVSGSISFTDISATSLTTTGDVTVNGGDISVVETAAGATGAELNLQQISASPAASDVVGLTNFIGRDDAGNDVTYAILGGVIEDPTDGAEIGSVVVQAQNGTASLATCCSFEHDGSYGIVQAGDGAAEGVFQSAGNFDLILQTGNATTGSITLTDGANGDILVTPNGSGAVVVPAAAGVESATANVKVPFMYNTATEIIAEGAGGAISVATYCTTIGADAGGDAFTMAAGTILGQLKKINFVSTSGGTGVVTFAGRATVNTLTFTAAGEYAVFMWDGTDWLDVELSSMGTFATPPVLSTV